jgi:serine/threonine protein kinase
MTSSEDRPTARVVVPSVDQMHGEQAPAVGVAGNGATPESVQDQAASGDDPRVTGALKEYLAALETGEHPDRQEFLSRHAEVAAELEKHLDGLEFIQQVAPQLQSSPGFAGDAVLRPPFPLGDFQIIRVIGRGGMGVVYEAEQLSLGRRVALKVLPFAATLDTRQLRRFKHEAQAAAHLHHPNIVPVHAVGCERGVHFYAMQFIDGQTLADVIRELKQADRPVVAKPAPTSSTVTAALLSTERRGRLRQFVRTVARIGIQAAEALEYAHQEGVVHRDIKPANLLIETRTTDAGQLADSNPQSGSESFRIWVTDFGLAQFHRDVGLTLTMTGDVMGTLRYMSPEQALGQRAAIDLRTDIYSLGVTLYELLTLEPVFSGRDRQVLLRQIGAEEPRPLRSLNQEIPAELETIILKATAKSPDGRYTTAQELADDLRRFVEDKPIQAKRATAWQRAAKWSRRHWPSILSASLAAALLLSMAVVGLAVSNMLIKQERDEKDVALRDKVSALSASEANLAEAKTQRDRADLNFQKAHDEVDNYFTRISETTLLDVPGLQPLRKELLEAALGYYQDFLADRSDDPRLRIELAAAYLRVGQIYSAIDRTDDAIKALDHGVDIVEELLSDATNASALVERLPGVNQGGRSIHRGVNAPSDPLGALRSLKRAAAVWERLVHDNPEIARFQRDLAATYSLVGELEQGMTQPSAALDSFKKARDTWDNLLKQEPASPRDRAGLAASLEAIGNTLNRLDEGQQAEQFLGQALELREQLVQDFPDKPEYKDDLVGSYEILGHRLLVSGRTEEAEQLAHRELVIRSALAADFPAMPAYQENLAISLFDYGSLLKRTDRVPNAVATYRQASAIIERLANDFPSNSHYRERLASYCHHLSILLKVLGEETEATAIHRNALALQENLATEVPADPRYTEELAWLLIDSPDVGDMNAVRAVATAQRAIELSPNFATAWRTLGAAQYRAGDWESAVKSLEKSIELRTTTRNPPFFLAMAYWQLGDKDTARKWFDRGSKWIEQHLPRDPELEPIRTEAANLLGVTGDR